MPPYIRQPNDGTIIGATAEGSNAIDSSRLKDSLRHSPAPVALTFIETTEPVKEKQGRNSGKSDFFVSVRKWEFILQLMILMEAALLPFSADLIIIWRGITDFE